MHQDRNFDLLRALECFVNTVQIGSMSDAARKLGITQSAVSQQIGNLEKTFGIKLIDRSLRPLRATSDGVQVFAAAVSFLDDAKKILASTSNIRSRELSRLRLSVLYSLSRILSPSIIETLHSELPINNIMVSSGLASDLRTALLEREADIVITSDPLLEVDFLERHEVFVEPFVLVVPSSIRSANISIDDLSKQLPFVRYHSNSPIGTTIEVHLRRLRTHIPNWCEFDIPDSVVAMVEAAKAWTITTPLHLMQGIRNWDLVRCLPFPGPGISRSTVVVARRGELHGLPRIVANLSRDILLRSVVPKLRERIPFLEYEVKQDKIVHISVAETARRTKKTP